MLLQKAARVTGGFLLFGSIMLLLFARERAINVTTMPMKTEKQMSNSGFAIPLENDTDLGLALLIAEDEDGDYEPVASATTINEAKGLAAEDLRCRRARLERDENPGLCPYAYRLWARGMDGEFRVACEVEA
jgi:hypothetical protein